MIINPTSTSDPVYRDIARTWLREKDGVLVLLRYDRSAGSRQWLVTPDEELFFSCMEGLPPRTSVTIVRGARLVLSGVAGADLRRSVADLGPAPLPDDGWLLFLEEEGPLQGDCVTVSRDELREELDAVHGRPVRIYEYPAWYSESGQQLQAYVPEPDGSVVAGVY